MSRASAGLGGDTARQSGAAAGCGPRRAVLLAAGLLLLAACHSASPAGGGSPTAVSSSASASTSANPAGSGRPTSAGPPVTAEGDCPYLDTSFVQDTVGQRIERTTTTSTSHEQLPSCTFYRSDGDPAAGVAVTAYPTEVEAQNAAIRQGTAAANPVDDLADGGVVLVGTDSTVLAVTSGRTLLVVSINQASSLEARAIAAQVTPLLG